MLLKKFWIDSLERFKVFNNVYGILDTSYVTYTIFGMTPYTRVKSSQGKFIYHSMGKKKYLISYCYSSLMTLAMVLSVERELGKKLTAFKSIVNIVLNTQIMIFGIFSINVFAARANALLKAYDNCYKADKVLKRLGFSLDYKIVHKITLCGLIVIGIFAALNFITDMVLKKGIIIYIRYSFEYSFPCLVTVIPVYHFYYIGTVALQRFKLINFYLKEDFTLITRNQTEFILLCIADVHSELCKAVSNVLYSSAFSIISFYFYTYLQFSLLVTGVMGVTSLTIDADTYLWNMIYILTTVAFMILATVLKHEARKTSYALCELTVAFYDDSIGTRRNTFLLQLLHQVLDLNIFGNFEVHLSRVLSDLQALVNLMMFVTQFRAK